MKKKIYFVLLVLAITSISYVIYDNNRYVKVLPINLENESFVKSNNIPINFYKNMQIVLNHYNEEYKINNDTILIKNKKMGDLQLMYNYTKKANDSIWLSKRVIRQN